MRTTPYITIDMDNKLSHFDAQNNAIMVDVSGKQGSVRTATATGRIHMNHAAFTAVQGGAEKGDVLGVARIAGIMALKRTHELVPLCHALPVEQAGIEFHLDARRREVCAVCTVKTSGKTGVEMEALTGVHIALLTVYDMLKAVDKGMVAGEIRLERKTGGKSGTYIREGAL